MKQKQHHTAQQPFHHPGIASRRLAATLLAAGVLLAGVGCSEDASDPAPTSKPAAMTSTPKPVAATHTPKPLTAGSTFQDCADCPEMVVIPSGSFIMGSPADEAERVSREGPQHRVNISRFAIGKYEITQGQWKAIMGNNPSHFQNCGDDCPVEKVSWDDAQQFIAKLNQKTGKDYRLPSEAEWEYAARAGTTTLFHTGNTITTSQANFDGVTTDNGSGQGMYRKTTTKVGSFAPNAFGLHDMHGNVWEWVADCYHDDYEGAPKNDNAWVDNCKLLDGKNRRVVRGGSWYYFSRYLRSASRNWFSPQNRNHDFGFRIARAY